MRRVVRAETSALEAEIAVGRFRGRHRARELGHGRRTFLIADVYHPDGQKDLVAIRIGGLAVGKHESLIQAAAPDGVKCNSAGAVLRRRLKAPDLLLMFRVRKVQDNQPEAAPRAVAAMAAIL